MLVLQVRLVLWYQFDEFAEMCSHTWPEEPPKQVKTVRKVAFPGLVLLSCREWSRGHVGEGLLYVNRQLSLLACRSKTFGPFHVWWGAGEGDEGPLGCGFHGG